MNAIHLVFKTDRFNLSRVEPNFINPCCFGEDVVTWLKSKLTEHGVQVSASGQEDWGWYLKARSGKDSYFLAISGNSDGSAADHGEWRVIVKKRRSLWDRIAGKGRISSFDQMLKSIEETLRGEPDFQDVRREAD
jgi:hypothetical protein